MSLAPLKVLFVDDEPAVCRAFDLVFRRDPVIAVQVLTDGREALRILAHEQVAVIASDYRMPEMDGVALLSTSRTVSPATRRVLVTGCGDFDVARQAVKYAGIHELVAKPWSNDDLRETMTRAARHFRLGRQRDRLATELHARTLQLEHTNQDLAARLRARTTNLLDSLIAALDLRDTETQWHSRRVATYARRLAEALGLDAGECDDVERGALLHDIGKIGIRDEILRKPGRLDPAEWAEMKRHPALGFYLLENIADLAGPRVIVLQHHERWDGAGYPVGLAGENIALGARIFHVADTLDAITSNRPYRAARGFAVARAEILCHRGTQFDPAVVAAYASIPDDEWAALGAPLLAHERIAA
jgi:response regulator RpfG family c-di-GMP phosphodiesterase